MHPCRIQLHEEKQWPPFGKRGIVGLTMWYELFLRREAPFDADSLRNVLPASAVVREHPSRIEVALPSGTLDLSLLSPDDSEDRTRLTGLDLLVPGGVNPALAKDACEIAFDLAEAFHLTVYDPQLGRTVTGEDTDAIEARMARFASYLTETVGLDEAVAAKHIEVDLPRQRMSPKTRFYVGLAVVVVLLAVVARYC